MLYNTIDGNAFCELLGQILNSGLQPASILKATSECSSITNLYVAQIAGLTVEYRKECIRAKFVQKMDRRAY